MNKINYKQVLQKYEPNFNTMITLIKQPVRFLQFTFKTEGYRQRKAFIKCENESGNDNIAIIDVIPGDRQTCRKNSFNSQIVKTKLCANDKYVLIFESDEKHTKVY
ncbi:unnamed protein product [Meloidogyne enterolobii]|uniref:Uncharacterized protein n=1 Tax=Meloidogyne enterolobii TaxID=390850 RepID=A0ACB0Z3S7_MELEN